MDTPLVRRAAVLVVALLALTYAGFRVAAERVERAEQENREAVLRQHLATMRRAIGSFRKDQGRYPQSLEELVPRYLRGIPADPMTNEASWRTSTEEVVQPNADFTTRSAAPQTYVIDVHSGAGAPWSGY